MIVYNLISSHIEPADLHTTVLEALERMVHYDIRYLPVIDSESSKFLGEVNRKQLLEVLKQDEPAFLYKTDDAAYISPVRHSLDAARTMFRTGREVYAIVDENDLYLGMLMRDRLLESLGIMLNLKETGAVIAVEMSEKDFTISNLIRLIELEDARILGLTVEQPSNERQIVVSIKLNITNLNRIASSLRRHGYTVVSESEGTMDEEELTDRADEFLRYLNI